MAETTDLKQTADLPAQSTASGKQENAVRPSMPNFEHTKIKSNFTQSPSTYWALTVPLLSARYVAEALNEVVKPIRKFYAKQKGALEETASEISRAEFKDKFWALGVGSTMLLVTGYYTASTYGDMRRQFKEAVGWEFNKDPEKVSFLDMVKSKNVLVREAAHNLASRTTKRFAVHAPFFFMLAPTPFRVNGEKISADAWLKGTNPIEVGGTRYDKLLGPKGSVNFGVGTNALYLASDALGRKRTFYEELQRLIDMKINHKDTMGQVVTTQDIINLYDRQARRDGAQLPKMNSSEWQNDVKLFERVADLMNQTYENTPKKEPADLTIPKLIYLMGMGLIKSDQPERNRAYVELANQYGIPAVKKVMADLQNGEQLETALAAFPAVAATLKLQPELQVTRADNAMLNSMGIAAASAASEPLPTPEPVLGVTQPDNAMLKSMGVATEMAAPPAQKSFANEGLMKPRPDAPPGTHAEKAMKPAEALAGISV